jgi:hypothetical protein
MSEKEVSLKSFEELQKKLYAACEGYRADFLMIGLLNTFFIALHYQLDSLSSDQKEQGNELIKKFENIVKKEFRAFKKEYLKP